jgi:hypothetical protein
MGAVVAVYRVKFALADIARNIGSMQLHDDVVEMRR